MRLHAALILLVLAAGTPHRAHAWGDSGHKVIAAIAEALLFPEARRQVTAILAADPDPLVGHDIAAAATWADRYRGANEDGARTRTRQWHFVDIEIDAPSLAEACFGHRPPPANVAASLGPARACLPDKIDQFRAELADPDLDPEERVVALKFLLHFLGDLHQPLHAADDDDKGGNLKRVTAPGFRAGTLHHFWDTEFVEQLGPDPAATAAALLRRLSLEQIQQWSAGTTQSWATESFLLARDHAYGQLPPPNRRDRYALTPAYITMAEADVAQQLTKAGVRLAAVLNGLYARPKPDVVRALRPGAPR
ncbi:MAG: S1/P1 nuclease [Acetobacteraceae bacterium]